jgi:hypothetical protein
MTILSKGDRKYLSIISSYPQKHLRLSCGWFWASDNKNPQDIESPAGFAYVVADN